MERLNASERNEALALYARYAEIHRGLNEAEAALDRAQDSIERGHLAGLGRMRERIEDLVARLEEARAEEESLVARVRERTGDIEFSIDPSELLGAG